MFKRFLLLTLVTCIWLLVTPAAAQDAATCEAGFRSVEHTMGQSCVPENPSRVVVLEWTYVEDLLALGVQPVGIADIQGYTDWVKIPVSLDESVVDVGTRNEPSLEEITKLNPDLIIAVNFRVTENYDELSAIAPTLVFNPYPTDHSSQFEEMKSTFTTLASVVNKAAEGEAVLATMQAGFDRAKAALETAGRGGEGFILSQGWIYDNVAIFRLFTDNAMAVEIMSQLGLENAWTDQPQQYGFSEIGIEGFAQLADQDFNFFYVAQDADNGTFGESPVWNSLTFVKEGHAYWMGGDVWLFGGPLSANLLVTSVLEKMGVELLEAEATAEASG